LLLRFLGLGIDSFSGFWGSSETASDRLFGLLIQLGAVRAQLVCLIHKGGKRSPVSSV
jgi:hypothetical protein